MAAGELARALLFAREPEWAGGGDDGGGSAPPAQSRAAGQREAALVALAVAAPEEAGLALAAELQAPNLDLHQRLTVLDTLCAAAQRLSAPGAALPGCVGGCCRNLGSRVWEACAAWWWRGPCGWCRR